MVVRSGLVLVLVCRVRMWPVSSTSTRSTSCSTTSPSSRHSSPTTSAPHPAFVNLLKSPGIDSKESIPPAYETWARICKPFKVPRNRFPVWQAGTTTPIWRTGPLGWRNRFLGIDSWRLQKRPQFGIQILSLLLLKRQLQGILSQNYQFEKNV